MAPAARRRRPLATQAAPGRAGRRASGPGTPSASCPDPFSPHGDECSPCSGGTPGGSGSSFTAACGRCRHSVTAGGRKARAMRPCRRLFESPHRAGATDLCRQRTICARGERGNIGRSPIITLTGRWLGSGLIDQRQKVTVAATYIAKTNAWAARS
jgi:hypothetical protein